MVDNNADGDGLVIILFKGPLSAALEAVLQVLLSQDRLCLSALRGYPLNHISRTFAVRIVTEILLSALHIRVERGHDVLMVPWLRSCHLSLLRHDLIQLARRDIRRRLKHHAVRRIQVGRVRLEARFDDLLGYLYRLEWELLDEQPGRRMYVHRAYLKLHFGFAFASECHLTRFIGTILNTEVHILLIIDVDEPALVCASDAIFGSHLAHARGSRF